MAVTLKMLEIEQKDTENRLAAIGGMDPSDYGDETRSELANLRTTLTRNGDQQIALKLAGSGDPEPIEKRTADPVDNRLLGTAVGIAVWPVRCRRDCRASGTHRGRSGVQRRDRDCRKQIPAGIAGAIRRGAA